MKVDLASGRYVVAVSGGVDSMVLLDLLRLRPDLDIIVAHYDHGIRHDSSEDRKLVQDVTKRHGVKFIYDEGNLGPETSEATARTARYDFLHSVHDNAKTHGIITAHHQDDLLETAILNLLRGTGRRGLSSLKSTDVIKRPLLDFSKTDLQNYAEKHDITWREDPTNTDTKYLRNYVRHIIVPKIPKSQQAAMIEIINKTGKLNNEIQSELVSLLHIQPSIGVIDRHWFIMLPHVVSCEVMAEWLRRHDVKNIDKKLVNKLVNISKASAPNRIADVDKHYILSISQNTLKLRYRSKNP